MSSQLPVELINDLEKIPHFNRQTFIAAHETSEQLVSVHVNPFKNILNGGAWSDKITVLPFDILEPVTWAPDSWYLSSRPSFTLDPLFHAGTYYVQEASGMFLAHAFSELRLQNASIRVLDLCAAPGGKSTMLQSLISKDSLLVSNEVIKTRIPPLCQNMTKWGPANCFVSNNDPSHFKKLPDFFDLMMIDAPCSGSGLFRKDPEAIKEWSSNLVHLCAQRQHRIIADVWDSLKENGYLIYSTCSFSKEENEDQLDQILKEFSCESIPLYPDPAWNIVETLSDKSKAYGYRFYPDKLKGEGFFIAVIQKSGSVQSNHFNKKLPQTSVSKKDLLQIEPWVESSFLEFVNVGDAIHALQMGQKNDFEILKNSLYLKKAGVRLGMAGEKTWIPDHELALSGIISGKISSIELDQEEALNYLRGQSVELDTIARGWQLLKYAGHGLGWVKRLDRRMNNYYPKSWRIRH